jgi:hypothetical protein
VSCFISLVKVELARIHAMLAVATAGSPLSLYIVIYAIRSTWQGNHRMKAVFNGENRIISIIARLLAIAGLIIWIALIAFILSPTSATRFTQVSCETYFGSVFFRDFFFLPVLAFDAVVEVMGPVGGFVVGLPIELTVLSWIIIIWRSRSQIWNGERTFMSGFLHIW